MNILFLDTSDDIFQVTIFSNKKILYTKLVAREKSHTKIIIPEINKALEEFSLSLKDIDAFAIIKGPGSFTGLRIGISTIKAAAFALNKKIIGINKLEAIAYFFIEEGVQIVPIISSNNKDEIFFGLYEPDYDKKKLIEKNKGQLGDFQKVLDIANKNCIFACLGNLPYSWEKLQKKTATQSSLKFVRLDTIDTNTILKMAYQKLEDEETEEIESFAPFYIKQFKVNI